MRIALGVGFCEATASREGCRNELTEERRRALRPRLELRVILSGDEERMDVGGQLNGLNEPLIRRRAADNQPCLLKLLAQRD